MKIWHSSWNRQGKDHNKNSDLGKLIFLAAFIWSMPVSIPAETPSQSLTKTLTTPKQTDYPVTSLMLAYMALDRNQAHVAAEQFMQLTKSYQQPIFAEKAMLAALQSFDLTLAYQAAGNWSQYAPNNPAALYFTSLLAIQNDAPMLKIN